MLTSRRSSKRKRKNIPASNLDYNFQLCVDDSGAGFARVCVKSPHRFSLLVRHLTLSFFLLGLA